MLVITPNISLYLPVFKHMLRQESEEVNYLNCVLRIQYIIEHRYSVYCTYNETIRLTRVSFHCENCDTINDFLTAIIKPM